MTRADLLTRYRAVRSHSLRLAAPLSAEDQCVQPMADASPVKWHLAHTSWFFEALVLCRLAPDYRVHDERFLYLFNSYYEALGPRQPRPQRGMITRPGLDEVLAYRRQVDQAIERFCEQIGDAAWPAAAGLIELGLQHEQQHQELILTDVKFLLSLNPGEAIYLPRPPLAVTSGADLQWLPVRGGELMVGHGGVDFAYDNETPRHRVFVHPCRLANRLVTCGEYLSFIDAGGYRRPEFWLADGWAAVCTEAWQAPLYWRQEPGGEWRIYTLHGVRPLEPDEPVCHVSFYEASAFAAWAQARLPTEFELEAAVSTMPLRRRATDHDWWHPLPAPDADGLLQVDDEAWNWTRSAYDPYPGFKPLPGAVGEYNGKFMVGQLVLRGGSCATSAGHVRPTYRNFFPPAARWQFSGIRLARDS